MHIFKMDSLLLFNAFGITDNVCMIKYRYAGTILANKLLVKKLNYKIYGGKWDTEKGNEKLVSIGKSIKFRHSYQDCWNILFQMDKIKCSKLYRLLYFGYRGGTVIYTLILKIYVHILILFVFYTTQQHISFSQPKNIHQIKKIQKIWRGVNKQTNHKCVSCISNTTELGLFYLFS